MKLKGLSFVNHSPLWGVVLTETVERPYFMAESKA